MAGRQRLGPVDVERRPDAALLKRGEQRRLVDQRPARGIDDDRARLHARELRRADDPRRALGEHHVQRDRIRRREELVLADKLGTRVARGRLGQVLAPGNDAHVHGLGDTGHAPADPAEAENAERPPLQHRTEPHVGLEAPCSHGPVAGRQVTEGGQQQDDGEL
jgi:hypothetical protein